MRQKIGKIGVEKVGTLNEVLIVKMWDGRWGRWGPKRGEKGWRMKKRPKGKRNEDRDKWEQKKGQKGQN